MNLFWSIYERKFVTGLRDPREITTIEVPARDILPISLAIVDRSSPADAYAAQALAADESLHLAVKVGPGETEYLFEEDSFDVPADADDPLYTAEIDTNTNAVIAAIATSEYVYVSGEIAMVKDGRNYYSTRFRIKLINDLIRPESTPSPVAGDKMKMIDGIPHLWNADQNKYFPISISGEAGQETFTVGGEGVEA